LVATIMASLALQGAYIVIRQAQLELQGARPVLSPALIQRKAM
jgi:hypothetical protein